MKRAGLLLVLAACGPALPVANIEMTPAESRFPAHVSKLDFHATADAGELRFEVSDAVMFDGESASWVDAQPDVIRFAPYPVGPHETALHVGALKPARFLLCAVAAIGGVDSESVCRFICVGD